MGSGWLETMHDDGSWMDERGDEGSGVQRTKAVRVVNASSIPYIPYPSSHGRRSCERKHCNRN